MPSNKWNLAIVAHEMGHGYGLPHSYGGGTEYNDPWDKMVIASGYRCSVNADPTYSCLGQHTIAYFKDELGWIPTPLKFVAPDGENTATLEQLAQPQTGNYLMAWVETPGDAAIAGYTVEARRRVGYDAKLAGDAVIIHRVNSGEIPELIDSDGGATDDAGSIWTPGEAFTDAANGVRVRVDRATDTGFVVTVNSPYQNPDFVPTSLWAVPANASAGGVVTFTMRLVNQGAPASNVVATMHIPNATDYVPNSATASQGTVIGVGPLIFTVGNVSDSTSIDFAFASVVHSDVASSTVISGTVHVSWDSGTLDRMHRAFVNGETVYLPLIER